MVSVQGMRRLARPVVRAAARWIAGATTTRRFNGARVRLPRRAAMHVPPFRDVVYEPHEWYAVEAAGRAGNSFLDVGANIGVLTTLMSRIAGPSGRVIAVEPQPQVYALLVDVLRRNACANTTPVQALLLDRCGAADLQISTATPLGVGSTVLAHEVAGITVRVPALTIDALYGLHDTVDYIKVDAEGAEHRILRGAAEVLGRCRPVVQVEVHGQYLAAAGESVHDLFDFMERQAYSCLNLAVAGETTADEFMQNTHYHVYHPETGEDLAHLGYGHVLFLPRERTEVREVVRADVRFSPANNSLHLRPLGTPS
jgi:FkbM family methyltransferase